MRRLSAVRSAPAGDVGAGLLLSVLNAVADDAGPALHWQVQGLF